MLLRLIMLCLAWGLAATASAADAVRAPTGKWVVDFAPAQCVAYRDYGTDAEPLRLVLKAPPLGEVMQVAVLRNGRLFQAEQVDVTVTVDERSPLKTNLLMFGPKGSKHVVYLLNMPSAEFALVRHAKELALRSKGLNESFALSQMEPLLKVMEECVADLREVWNVRVPDNAPLVGLERRATSDLARHFSDSDYPAVSIRQGDSGTVRFAMLIGEDGRVADCTVIATSGAAALDGQACAVLRDRAKFKPALDKDGKPTKDSHLAAVKWKIRE